MFDSFMCWKEKFLNKTAISKNYIYLFIAASFSLLIGLFFVWQPIPKLLNYAADDAFYYLQIARNTAKGMGISFDGISATNGFHPLYWLFLVLLFIASPDTLELNTHLALTFCLLTGLGSAVPLFLSSRKLWGSLAGEITSVSWLLCPWVLFILVKGVETGFYMFFASWSVYLYILYKNHGVVENSTLYALTTGLLLGFTFLARSDGIFLVAAIALDQILIWNGKNKFTIDTLTMKKLVDWLWMAGSFTIVLLPWLLWNYKNFKSVIQVSGQAVYWHNSYNLNGNASLIIIICAIIMLIRIIFLTNTFILTSTIGGIFIGGKKRFDKQEIKPVLFLFYYAFFLFSFYGWYLKHFQIWYFAPFLLIFAILLGSRYHRLCKKQENFVCRYWLPRKIAVISLLIGLGIGIGLWTSLPWGYYPAQPAGYKIAKWLLNNTHPNERIGAWNSGIIGYFSDRHVINLDGVVNNELLQYVHSHDIGFFNLNLIKEYVYSKQINYLTDYENSSSYLSDFLAQSNENLLVPVYSFPSTGADYQVTIYKFKP